MQDLGGINSYTMDCLPVRKIIHSLKLVDYLHIQADNPWYNYNLFPRVFSQQKCDFREISV